MFIIALDASNNADAGYYSGFFAGHLIISSDRDEAQSYDDHESAVRTAEILSLLFATVATVEQAVR
jgi:hypothetical protein